MPVHQVTPKSGLLDFNIPVIPIFIIRVAPVILNSSITVSFWIRSNEPDFPYMPERAYIQTKQEEPPLPSRDFFPLHSLQELLRGNIGENP